MAGRVGSTAVRVLLRVDRGPGASCDLSPTSQILTQTPTVTCPWKMTRVAPMPLPTRQTARRKRKRRRRPFLESQAGTACWGPGLRDCPCTVPPRVGQRQGCGLWGQWEGKVLGR